MFINRNYDTLDLSDFKTCTYISTCVQHSVPVSLLISDSYTSIRNAVSDWATDSGKHKPKKICGPKGTGKTLCLLALMSEPSILHNRKAIFVSSQSFKECNLAVTSQYLDKVTKGINPRTSSTTSIYERLMNLVNIRTSSTTSIYERLMNLVNTEEVVLFMDFDDLDNSEIVNNMCLVASHSYKAAVLAMLSGDGHDINPSCRCFHMINQEFATLQHLPFTEEEMEYFINLNKIKFSKEELLPITGCNPLLLSLAITAEKKSSLICYVDWCIKHFIECNLKISTTLPIHFVNSLKLSEKYLWMAFNDSNPINDEEFLSSWVAQNNICFLQDNQVKINFPRLPQLLKQDVRRIVRDHKFDISTLPQVRGFVLEEIFFEFARDNSIAVEDESKSITFKVNQVQQLYPGQGTLIMDVLYRLRVYHPVIDAVGKFSQKDGRVVLAYFQISVSSYNDHSKKIKDLFEENFQKKGYSELTANCRTIDKYYKSKASLTNPTVYYVYISTTTTSKNTGTLGRDARQYSLFYSVLSEQSELYKLLSIC